MKELVVKSKFINHNDRTLYIVKHCVKFVPWHKEVSVENLETALDLVISKFLQTHIEDSLLTSESVCSRMKHIYNEEKDNAMQIKAVCCHKYRYEKGQSPRTRGAVYNYTWKGLHCYDHEFMNGQLVASSKSHEMPNHHTDSMTKHHFSNLMNNTSMNNVVSNMRNNITNMRNGNSHVMNGGNADMLTSATSATSESDSYVAPVEKYIPFLKQSGGVQKKDNEYREYREMKDKYKKLKGGKC